MTVLSTPNSDRPNSDRPKSDRPKSDLGMSALLIAGPTASGKTALAVSLAKTFDGVVINADSMQVYSDLRVLTARPTIDEQEGVDHLLFGHVDGAVNYSAGKWLRDAQDAINSARASRRLPIITGGTGLYFKSLVEGLSDIPPVPAEVRADIRAETAGLTDEALKQRVEKIDPVAASRIRSGDRQRLERAMEVHAASGQPLSFFQERRSEPLLDLKACSALFLTPDRSLLYTRINRRFEHMMEVGALEEVRALAARDLDRHLPIMRAHGVPGLIDYLNGNSSRDEAIARGQMDTRHYAKRQFTWFRHQLPEFEWVEPDQAFAVVEKRCGRA